MLRIGIEYLNGWAMATNPTNRQEPEWPPHPDRIFMALAAAHFETDGNESERAVLEWLETLGDPCLLVSPIDPERHQRSAVTTYVPVNDSADPIKKNKPLMVSGSLPIGRDRQPRIFPVVVPPNPRVGVIWEDAEPTPDQLCELERLCAKVTSIGHSASLVGIWVADANSPIEMNADERKKLLPCQNGKAEHRLRVFGPGRLADLEALYNKAAIDDYTSLSQKVEELKPAVKQTRGQEKKQLAAELAEVQARLADRYGDSPPQSLRPTPSLWRGYSKAQDETPQAVCPHTHWSQDLIVLTQVEGRRFGLESTLQLTKVFRKTVMCQSGRQPAPEWLSGHQPTGEPSERAEGHVAFLPLPHVGREHADGHLLGMALAIPRDVPRDELSECLFPMLFGEAGWSRKIELTLGRLGTCLLKLDEIADARQALRSETWTAINRPSRHWGTVTPIALDRHAKGDDPMRDISHIIAAACLRIGLPTPEAVIPTPVSPFIGALTGREMPRIIRKRDNGKIRHVHAVIEFENEIVGPVLVGAGRYRGYGLCRPLAMEDLR